MFRRAPFRRPSVPPPCFVPGRFTPLLLVLLAFPSAVTAQQNCTWGSGTRSFSSVLLPTIGRQTFVSHPHLVCADGVEIWADTAVTYAAQGMSDLWGHVRYQDSTRELRADTARYFSQMGRLQAHGSVFVRDTAQGSTIQHGDLVYLLKTSERSEDEMTVTVRPGGERPHAILRLGSATDTTRVDTAGVPADTGAAKPDMGAAKADTGAAKADTGAAKPDMGAAKADTGAAKADTGATRPDTGVAKPAPAPPDTTPYDVVANRIVLRGDRYFVAVGKVVMRRDSLQAFSDSAMYDRMVGKLLLDEHARVTGPSYTLTAKHVAMGVSGGAIRDVLATKDAVLVGQDLRLTSPSIHMFLKGGLLNSLVAVPLLRDTAKAAPVVTAKATPADTTNATPADTTKADTTKAVPTDTADARRPVAVVEKYHLTADSLQVEAPGQQLKRVVAVGHAQGESYARDSLNVPSLPPVARTDWVNGDTVIVAFVPVPPDSAADSVHAPPGTAADSTRPRFRVDRLVAIGNATSLYRMAPSDTAVAPGICPPSVHYVKGSQITIVMKKGALDSMGVVGPTQGYQLEPRVRCGADTTSAQDSLGAARDTTKAGKGAPKLQPDTLPLGHLPVHPSKTRGGGGGAPDRGGAPWLPALPGSWPAPEWRP